MQYIIFFSFLMACDLRTTGDWVRLVGGRLQF